MRARIIQENELGARVLFALSTYRLMCRFFEDSIGFRGEIPLNVCLGELWPMGSLL